MENKHLFNCISIGKEWNYRKINSKWDKNIRSESNIASKNAGGKFLVIGHPAHGCDNKKINNYIKLKTSSQKRKLSTEWKSNLEHGRKYLKAIYLIKD
jgi:hypothetical protein